MATYWLQARGAEPDEDGRTHEDLGPQLNTAFWVLTGLATVFLGLRLYCKGIRVRNLWWDDYLLTAAWVRRHPGPLLSESSSCGTRGKMEANTNLIGRSRHLGGHHLRLRDARLRQELVRHEPGVLA